MGGEEGVLQGWPVEEKGMKSRTVYEAFIREKKAKSTERHPSRSLSPTTYDASRAGWVQLALSLSTKWAQKITLASWDLRRIR